MHIHENLCVFRGDLYKSMASMEIRVIPSRTHGIRDNPWEIHGNPRRLPLEEQDNGAGMARARRRPFWAWGCAGVAVHVLVPLRFGPAGGAAEQRAAERADAFGEGARAMLGVVSERMLDGPRLLRQVLVCGNDGRIAYGQLLWRTRTPCDGNSGLGQSWPCSVCSSLCLLCEACHVPTIGLGGKT
eukprot:gene19790-biopygen22066